MKITHRFATAFTLSGVLALPGAPQAAPPVPNTDAILLRVTGAVRVERGGKKIAGRDGLKLQRGDKIVVASGGATVFALGRPPRRLGAGRTLIVSGAAPSLWKGVYNGLSRGLDAPRPRIAATMRPGEVEILAPRHSVIEAGRPRFS